MENITDVDYTHGKERVYSSLEVKTLDKYHDFLHYC